MNTKCKLGGVETLSFINTDGAEFSVFFQGCTFGCKGCHNQELQPVEGGYETTTDEILALIAKGKGIYDYVCFLGGEPLLQPDALKELLGMVKGMGIKTWLYTGYDYKDIPPNIVELCDCIVSGRYVEELATGGFPASSNQEIHRK